MYLLKFSVNHLKISRSSKFNSIAGLSFYPINIYYGGARGVMVIVIGVGHDDTSSNPGRD